MTDKEYMNLAIELAKRGEGFTNPNPLVGAVIVKNGRVIGSGYHERYGELHAERNAIASLTEDANGATLYVTLEPCCHYGKTPPCTEAIIENQIARVVIGSSDPNPKVAGKGVEILRKAGVMVEENFMREECNQLNPVFFHYITQGTPYVVMKYAMTADGKIATKTGASKWVTGIGAREEVQKMRARYMGIMVGIGTVLADDPMLTTRIEGLRSPIRIILDSNLRIPYKSQICKTAKEYKTIVACAIQDKEKQEQLETLGVEVVQVPDDQGRVDLAKLMMIFGTKGIDSILLEGGGTVNYSALKSNIIQEIKAFMAPKIFGGYSSKSPVEGLGIEKTEEAIMLESQAVTKIGEDLLITYKVRRN